MFELISRLSVNYVDSSEISAISWNCVTFFLNNFQLSLKTKPAQVSAERCKIIIFSKIIFLSYIIDEVQEQTNVSSSKMRTRTRLTDYQKQVLERVFASSPYLTSTQQTEVANGLGITKQVLQVCNFLLMHYGYGYVFYG